MTAIDTDFYRAFAERVREQVTSLYARPVQADKPQRQYAVCAGCGSRQRLRLDGRIAKHEFPWSWPNRARCAGAETTPVPIPVPDRRPVAGTAPTLPQDHVPDRWDFLTLPLSALLHHLRARVRDVCAPSDDFAGALREITNPARYFRWVVETPVGLPALEYDAIVRYLLATVHGIDTTDWPLPLDVNGRAL